jgi:hypothetical protein
MYAHELGLAADTALVHLKRAIYPQMITFNNLTSRDRIINMSETIEEMYKGKFSEYENVCAARRAEKIEASNPYGCNQYGHRKGHGDASTPELKKSETKSKETQKEEQKEKTNEQPLSLYKQLEQAQQEAISLVRKGKAYTPEHRAALDKLQKIKDAYEKEKKKEQIEKYKKEKEQAEKERQRFQQKKRKKELEELYEEQSIFGKH